MKKGSLRQLTCVLRFTFVAFVLATVCQHHLLTSYRISGNSMLPAFHDGDRVVVATLPQFLSDPSAGDTVIAQVNGETLIKRVAGVPGDVIEIRGGHLIRNEVEIIEAIPEELIRGSMDMSPQRLGEKEYFLLGDHRRVSIDSRDFGPISRDSIVGEVVFRLATAEPIAAAALGAE